LAALRSRAACFGVIGTEGLSELDCGPLPGSLSAETRGATFDLASFRADAGPVLSAFGGGVRVGDRGAAPADGGTRAGADQVIFTASQLVM